MQKSIKKAIAALLMLYLTCGLTYFFIFTCSSISFVSSFISTIGWYSYFFNDGMLLPLFIFIPAAFIIAAIIWIFYRKDTTVMLRSVITAIPVWQIISFYAAAYISDPASLSAVKIFNVILIAVFIVIYFLLFRELYRLFRKA